MNTGYHIYNFEKGRFWEQSQYGYTDRVEDSGKFDYEEAVEIVKNSNIQKIKSEMVHSSDVNRLAEIVNEVGIKDKRALSDVVESISKSYHPNNPFSILENSLAKNGNFLEEDVLHRSLSNGENQRFSLFFEGNNQGLNIVITRLGTGNYELIGNTITRKNDYDYEKEVSAFKNKVIERFTSDVDSFVLQEINKKDMSKVENFENFEVFLTKKFLERNTRVEDSELGISDKKQFLIKKDIFEKSGFLNRFRTEINIDDTLLAKTNKNKLK